MPELHEEHEAQGRGGSVMVFLSLYLLLLAFFILLNTISQREYRRSQIAMGSVAATFRAPLPADVVDLTTSTGQGVLAVADPFHRDIRRVFEDTLPVQELKVVRQGNTMRISVPVAHLFVAGRSEFRDGAAALMNGIADGVIRREPGVRFEVDLHLLSGKALPALESNLVPEATAGVLPTAVLRAGAFARWMRDAGVAPESINAGLGIGEAGIAQFSFHARELERARVSFAHVSVQP